MKKVFSCVMSLLLLAAVVLPVIQPRAEVYAALTAHRSKEMKPRISISVTKKLMMVILCLLCRNTPIRLTI